MARGRNSRRLFARADPRLYSPTPPTHMAAHFTLQRTTTKQPVIRDGAKKVLTKADRLLLSLIKSSSAWAQSDPIFIIGPPRSGTTLTYQLLTQCLDVAYITNLEARFPYAPLLGASFSKWRKSPSRKDVDFSSEYGRTHGKLGPNEAGQFWYRWFPGGEKVYVRSGELPEECRNDMHAHVRAIQNIKGGNPLCFKNVYHSARIGALKETFPDATFLIVKRPPLEIAQSILRARRKAGSGKENWWSIPLPPPIGIPEHMDWAQQIVRQTHDIYAEIESQRKAIGEDAFLDIDYQQLCNRPGGMVERIMLFLNQKQVKVTRTATPPTAFPIHDTSSVNQGDLDALNQAFENIPNFNKSAI